MKELNGIFGFVCVGNDGADMIAARDHCGNQTSLHSGKVRVGARGLHLNSRPFAISARASKNFLLVITGPLKLGS